MAQSLRTITITPELVAKWEKEAAELQGKIDDYTTKLRLVRQRLEAIPLFLEEENPEACVGEAEAQQPRSAPSPLSLPPASYVRFILRDMNGVTTVSELRERIKESSYPSEKFGTGFSYFYTILKRMQKANEIIRENDKLWLKRRDNVE